MALVSGHGVVAMPVIAPDGYWSLQPALVHARCGHSDDAEPVRILGAGVGLWRDIGASSLDMGCANDSGYAISKCHRTFHSDGRRSPGIGEYRFIAVVDCCVVEVFFVGACRR
jgi:hypothetical protein